MLTAGQLRVNNYVHYNGMNLPISSIKSPKPLKDKIYSDKWIIELFDGATWIDCTIDDIKPIELTEEWLLKMGFEKKYDDLFTKRLSTYEYYIFCYIDKNTGAEIGISINNQRSYFKNGKVHQLQNLYHALTGEELTIK